MKITPYDILFLSLRITFFLSLIYIFGLIYGVVIKLTTSYLYFHIMKYVFGMEKLLAEDNIFILDHDKNPSNIISKISNSIKKM